MGKNFLTVTKEFEGGGASLNFEPLLDIVHQQLNIQITAVSGYTALQTRYNTINFITDYRGNLTLSTDKGDVVVATPTSTGFLEAVFDETPPIAAVAPFSLYSERYLVDANGDLFLGFYSNDFRASRYSPLSGHLQEYIKEKGGIRQILTIPNYSSLIILLDDVLLFSLVDQRSQLRGFFPLSVGGPIESVSAQEDYLVVSSGRTVYRWNPLGALPYDSTMPPRWFSLCSPLAQAYHIKDYDPLGQGSSLTTPSGKLHGNFKGKVYAMKGEGKAGQLVAVNDNVLELESVAGEVSPEMKLLFEDDASVYCAAYIMES